MLFLSRPAANTPKLFRLVHRSAQYSTSPRSQIQIPVAKKMAPGTLPLSSGGTSKEYLHVLTSPQFPKLPLSSPALLAPVNPRSSSDCSQPTPTPSDSPSHVATLAPLFPPSFSLPNRDRPHTYRHNPSAPCRRNRRYRIPFRNPREI